MTYNFQVGSIEWIPLTFELVQHLAKWSCFDVLKQCFYIMKWAFVEFLYFSKTYPIRKTNQENWQYSNLKLWQYHILPSCYVNQKEIGKWLSGDFVGERHVDSTGCVPYVPILMTMWAIYWIHQGPINLCHRCFEGNSYSMQISFWFEGHESYAVRWTLKLNFMDQYGAHLPQGECTLLSVLSINFHRQCPWAFERSLSGHRIPGVVTVQVGLSPSSVTWLVIMTDSCVTLDDKVVIMTTLGVSIFHTLYFEFSGSLMTSLHGSLRMKKQFPGPGNTVDGAELSHQLTPLQHGTW